MNLLWYLRQCSREDILATLAFTAFVGVFVYAPVWLPALLD